MRVGAFVAVAICPALSFADTLPTYFQDMRELRSWELGEFVERFIPKNGEAVFWDYLANDHSIVWAGKAYHEAYLNNGEVASSRLGLFRASVDGRNSTYLADRKYELPWTVKFTGGAAKFGVEKVTFFPGASDLATSRENWCFGVAYGNCEFNPIPSLEKAGVSAVEVCSSGGGQNFSKGYALRAGDREPTYAVYDASGGAGGTMNSLTLLLNATKESMCGDVDAR